MHHKLVVERRDGSFRGGRVVLPEELGVRDGVLALELALLDRCDAAAASGRNVVVATNQTSIGIEAFFDTSIT